MPRTKPAPCSPYLRQRRRSLAEACSDILRRKSTGPAPCPTCDLAALCEHSKSVETLPEPQSRHCSEAARATAHQPAPQSPGRDPTTRRDAA